MTPLIILGCGYIGHRVARAALAAGRTVRVCARSTGKLAPLGELGAQIKYLNAAMPNQLHAAASGLPGATVLYSIPPITELPPGHAMRNALQAAAAGKAGCFIYFSSSGLFGAQPDDDAWIDDDTPIARDDPPMQAILTDEEAIANCTYELRTVVLRLAPVYGPGRGMRAQLRKGKYRLNEEGRHATSRIHIDDVVQIVFAAEERAASGSRYLVADDEPTTQRDYAQWLSERMGLPMPGSKQQFAHRNRRIRNERMKRDLGITLRYPSYRDGEAAIEAEEAGT